MTFADTTVHNSTDLTLSSTRVVEFSANGTAIGAFSTIDPDPTDTFTYTFDTTCDNSSDNGKFTIA